MAQDKRVAIYPGTFDPLTNGHANIIRRGLRMFDNIIVAVAADTGKSPLFSLEERVAMAEKVFAKEPNISVEPFQGLLVEYVARRNVHTVLRGLRAVSDFEYEFQIALMNRKLRPDIEVIGKPCPLFVPLVEEGLFHDSVTDEIASRYLSSLKEKYIDTLVMGCTHYPLIRSTIRKVMGDKVNLVNPAYETAIELKNLLERDNLANKCDVDSPSSMYRFYVSDAEEKFKLFANSILPFDITMTKQINIENY